MKKATPESGFTLIEVMAALAILSGVIVTTLASVNYHLEASVRARDIVTATILGRYKAEETRLMGGEAETEGDFGPAFEGFRWKTAETTDEATGLKRYEIESIGPGGPVVFVMYREG